MMQRYRSSSTKEPIGFVYILSNYTRTVLYTGVTRNIIQRVKEHRNHVNTSSFTSKYHCYDLIYFEYFDFLTDAIAREKQLKKWNRQWKIELIQQQNPEFKDLYDDVVNGTFGDENYYF